MKKTIDALVVFGKGVEQVRARDGTIVWRPTRLIEKPSSDGSHTGWRTPRYLRELTDPTYVIGGSNANVIAVHQLLQEHPEIRYVLFAAGRPKYLVATPNAPLCEGYPMFANLCLRFGLSETPSVVEVGCPPQFARAVLENREYYFFSKSRNTFDEVAAALGLGQEAGVRRMAFLTLAVHLLRVKEFTLAAKQHYGIGFEAIFLASDDVLLRRSPKYRRILDAVAASQAMRNERNREHKGLEDFLRGRYQSVQYPPSR